jgi:hypothetical protein
MELPVSFPALKCNRNGKILLLPPCPCPHCPPRKEIRTTPRVPTRCRRSLNQTTSSNSTCSIFSGFTVDLLYNTLYDLSLSCGFAVDFLYSFSICCTAFRFVVQLFDLLRTSRKPYSTVSICCGFAVDLSYSFSLCRTAFRFVVYSFSICRTAFRFVVYSFSICRTAFRFVVDKSKAILHCFDLLWICCRVHNKSTKS